MTFVRQALAGLRLLLVMTVLLGMVYPSAISLAARALPGPAQGSLVTMRDGQSFEGPQWFQPRPSASDYSGDTSGGTNQSPLSATQRNARRAREADLRAANPNATDPVPEDALTASASGLDPHISAAYAQWQLPRVAKARDMSPADLAAMIETATDRAPLGYLGQDGVNVTKLNLALAER